MLIHVCGPDEYIFYMDRVLRKYEFPGKIITNFGGTLALEIIFKRIRTTTNRSVI